MATTEDPLDLLLPVRELRVDGVAQKFRKNLDFDSTEFTVEDHPESDSVKIVNGRSLRGVPLDPATPTLNQVLAYVGGVAKWVDPDTLPPVIPTQTVVAFAAGAYYASAVAAHGTDAVASIRVTFQILASPSLAAPASGLRRIAGYTIAGAEGWLICQEETGLGASVAQLVVYVGADATLKRVARKFILPEMVGQLARVHISMRSGFLHVYFNGHEITDNSANNYGPGRSFTTYVKPTGTDLKVGGDATYPCEQGIVEVAMSTVAMTDAQVLADALLPVGSPMAGEIHGFRSSSLPAATWNDQSTPATNLTRTGSVSVTTPKADIVRSSGSFNRFGDSITRGTKPLWISTISALSGNGVSPISITTPSAHGLLTGDVVGVRGVLGNTAANGGTWTVTVTSSTTFTLNGSTGNGAYTGRGIVYKGATSGDGWGREVQRICCASGATLTWVGAFAPAAPDNYDWDVWNNGTSGEQLATRLLTLASDLAAYGPPGAGVVFAYGINDFVVGNRTALQFQADLASACAMVKAARGNVPIIIVNVYDVATDSASAPQHAQIQAQVAAFPSVILHLRALGFNVYGADPSSVIDANDETQVYDGTHPTAGGYEQKIAPVVAAAIQEAIAA